MNPGNPPHNLDEHSPKLESTDSEGEPLGSLMGISGPLNLEAVRHLYENTGRSMRNILANRRSLPSKRSSEAYSRELENLLIEKDNEILLAADIGQALLKEIHSLQAKVTLLENKPYQEAEEIVEEIRKSDRDILKKLKNFRLEAESISSSLKEKPGKFLPPGSPYVSRRNANSLLDSNDTEDGKSTYDSSHSELNKTAEAADALLEVTKTLQKNLAESEKKLHLYMEMAAEHERQVTTLGMQINRNVEHEAKLQEATWNMELEIQELKSKLDESETNLSKALNEQKKLQDKLTGAKETIDNYKDREEVHLDHLERTKARHEQEMTGMRRVISNLQREKAELHKTVDELRSELNGKIQRMGGRPTNQVTPFRDGTTPNANTPSELSDFESFFNSPNQTPHNVAVQGQSLQMETLNGSLSHAHRTIATLRSSLHREKIEKLELKKMLAESQEKVEIMEKDVLWESDNAEAVMRKVNFSVSKKTKMKRRKTNLKDALTRTKDESGESRVIAEDSFISEDSNFDHTDPLDDANSVEDESLDDDENVMQDPEESHLDGDSTMNDVFNGSSNFNNAVGIKRRRSRPALQKNNSRSTTRNPLVSKSTQESPVSTRALFNELSMVDQTLDGIEEGQVEATVGSDKQTPTPVKKTVDMGVQVSLLDIHTSRHSKFGASSKGLGFPSRFDFNFSPSDLDNLPFKNFSPLFDRSESASPEHLPNRSLDLQQYTYSTPIKPKFSFSDENLESDNLLNETEPRKRMLTFETPTKRGTCSGELDDRSSRNPAISSNDKYHARTLTSSSTPAISVTSNHTSPLPNSRDTSSIYTVCSELHEDSSEKPITHEHQTIGDSDPFRTETSNQIEKDESITPTADKSEKELNKSRDSNATVPEALDGEHYRQSKSTISNDNWVLTSSADSAKIDDSLTEVGKTVISKTPTANSVTQCISDDNRSVLVSDFKLPSNNTDTSTQHETQAEFIQEKTEKLLSIKTDSEIGTKLEKYADTTSNGLPPVQVNDNIESDMSIKLLPTPLIEQNTQCVNEEPYTIKQSETQQHLGANYVNNSSAVSNSIEDELTSSDKQISLGAGHITPNHPRASETPICNEDHSTSNSSVLLATKSCQELKDTTTLAALDAVIQPSRFNTQGTTHSVIDGAQKAMEQKTITNNESSQSHTVNPLVDNTVESVNQLGSRTNRQVDEPILENEDAVDRTETILKSNTSETLESLRMVSGVEYSGDSNNLKYSSHGDATKNTSQPLQPPSIEIVSAVLSTTCSQETEKEKDLTHQVVNNNEDLGDTVSLEKLLHDEPIASRDQLARNTNSSRSTRRSVHINQLDNDLIIQGVNYPADVLNNNLVNSHISDQVLPTNIISSESTQPFHDEQLVPGINTREIGTQTLESCTQPTVVEPMSPAMKPPPLPGTSRIFRQKQAAQHITDKRNSSASESSTDDERIAFNEVTSIIRPSTSQTSIAQKSVNVQQTPGRNMSIRHSSAMQDYLRENRLSVSAPHSPLFNDNRQNLSQEEAGTDAVSLEQRRTIGVDPSIIHAITQTMMGNYMWKYTRKVIGSGISEKKHLRFFWVHPYAKTINWCAEQSGTDLYRSKTSKTKVQYVTSVRVVLDQQQAASNPDTNPYSLIIQTPNREMKIKALEKERHDLWLLALTYLQTRQPVAPISANSFRSRRWSAGSNNNSTLESDDEHTQNTTTPPRNNSSFILPPSQMNHNLSRTLSAKQSLSRLFKRPSRATLNTGAETVHESEELDDVKKCCQGKHDINQLSQ